MPGQSLDYSKQTEGDGRFLPPSHTPSQANPSVRSLQAKINGPAQARLTHLFTHTLPLSWLAWTAWTCLWEARLARRREAGCAANTLQHSQSTGAALLFTTTAVFSRLLAAANNSGAIGTAGTARRWTAWGLGARSVNLTIDPMCVRWGHVLGAFGGTRDHGTNSRQLTARRSRSHGSGAEFG